MLVSFFALRINRAYRFYGKHFDTTALATTESLREHSGDEQLLMTKAHPLHSPLAYNVAGMRKSVCRQRNSLPQFPSCHNMPARCIIRSMTRISNIPQACFITAWCHLCSSITQTGLRQAPFQQVAAFVTCAASAARLFTILKQLSVPFSLPISLIVLHLNAQCCHDDT